MGWGNIAQQKVMRSAATDFEKDHPGVQVEYINSTGAQHYVKLDTMLAGGDPPSVFYMDPSRMPAYASKATLAPLDPFVSADQYDVKDFFPKAIGQYDWRGKLYGIPRGFGNQDLYWNVALLKAKGVPSIPTRWDDPAWTVEKFLAIADQLTVRSGNKVVQYGYGQSLGLRQWEPWVWIFGGQVTDKTNQKCLLDQETAVAGLQFLADLMHKHKVMPLPDYTQQESNDNLFGTGRLAMVMDIPAALASYRKFKSLNWDVAPLPRKAQAVTSGGGIAWVMQAHAPAEAWKLLAWLAGPKVQQAECEAATTAPPRVSIAKSRCYVDPSRPPEHMQVFLDAPQYVHVDPQAVNWPQIQTLIDKEFAFIWDGSRSAREVTRGLVPKVNALLSQSEKSN